MKNTETGIQFIPGQSHGREAPQNNLQPMKIQQKSLLKIGARANLKARNPRRLPRVKHQRKKSVRRKAHKNQKAQKIPSSSIVVKAAVRDQENPRLSSKSSI